MKDRIKIILFGLLINVALTGQVSVHPNVILYGSDTIPYGDMVADTFHIFDIAKGGTSIGFQFFNPWHRDSIGVGSFAAGAGSIASADYGISLGTRCKVRGIGGVAIGSHSSSTKGGMSLGSSCEASGSGSVAIGMHSKAYGGEGCISTGYFTQSNGNSCTVIGRFNDTIVTRGNAIDGSSTGPLFIIGNGDGATNLSNAMVVRKDGKMGLGINSPAYRLHIKNSAGSSVIGLGGTEGRMGMAFRENGNEIGSFTWDVNEQQFILTKEGLIVFRAVGGKMGIGRTPFTNNLEVNGSASKDIAGNWLANSDRRIKKDIRGIENSLTTLLKLRPVKFKYTDEWLDRNPNIKDHYYYNYIAQEYGEVFPESVQGSGEYLENDTKEILQIDTYNAQIVNIKATQELIKMILELEKEKKEMKQEIAHIKEALAQIQNQLIK